MSLGGLRGWPGAPHRPQLDGRDLRATLAGLPILDGGDVAVDHRLRCLDLLANRGHLIGGDDVVDYGEPVAVDRRGAPAYHLFHRQRGGIEGVAAGARQFGADLLDVAVRSLSDWRVSGISDGLRTERRGGAKSAAGRRRFWGGSLSDEPAGFAQFPLQARFPGAQLGNVSRYLRCLALTILPCTRAGSQHSALRCAAPGRQTANGSRRLGRPR